jgi:sec-independent protein translocase protein TatC
MADEKLPFTEHLEELRKRIVVCIIATGIGFCISYFFSEKIFYLLSLPLHYLLPPESNFIFTGVTEAFFTYLKLALFSGIFIASPVILYEIWCFVAPGLYDSEKQYAFPFVCFSTIFFVGGALFGYLVVFPIAFKFFISYHSESIKILPSIKEYLSFSCKLLLAFGVVFELPVFILFLSKLGIINDKQLRSNRKFVVILVFIIAAFLTPPDVISQILMAFPLIVLYEISIIVAGIFGKKEKATNS